MTMIKLFLAQCFFRPLPQDLEISERAFEYSAVFYMSVFWAIQGLLIDPAEASIAAACEVLLTLAFIAVVLWWNDRFEFFYSSAVIMMGSIATIGLLAIPVIVWLRLASGSELVLSFYVMMLFPLWGLAVVGHFFRQLLAKPRSVGFGMACAYAVETYLGTLVLLVL